MRAATTTMINPFYLEAAPSHYYTADAPVPIIGAEPLPRGVVYLLHFDRPISPDHTCQHYIGWTQYLPGRIAVHLGGRGAKLTKIARERGIGFVVARTWPGDRHFERHLKNQKNGPRLCPQCNPKIGSKFDLDLLDALL